MTLSAVLFDMDGLLVDTEPLWLEAEVETMAALGGTWSEADQRAILGSSLSQATAYMRRASGTDLAEQDVGRILIDSMLRRLRDREFPTRPGAAQLVAEVCEEGIPFALVSASVRALMDVVLHRLSSRGWPPFPVTVAGDEVARGKPDPLPYRRAAQLLGVDISRAVVLEDSRNGARAGVAAGAAVLAIPHAQPMEPAGRLHVRPSLLGVEVADLRALVASSDSV